LLSVEEVLHVGLGSLQLVDPGLKLCNQQRQSGSDSFEVLPISTQHINGVPLFLLRRDLFFRTIVILGEGAIQLRLHRGGVLPGLHELLL
jgi:hypothetical protein